MRVPGWLRRIEPPVPESFLPALSEWLPPGSGVGDDDLPGRRGLEGAAMTALRRALGAHEGDRAGAFDLLAADALLTWAAEAALLDDDPESLLSSLAREATRSPGPS